MDIIRGDKSITDWVGQRVECEDFGPCETLAVVDETQLLAGVVYSNYRNASIEMSIATTTPRWASRRVIRELLNYPFVQLGCRRVHAMTSYDNKKAQRLLDVVGFVREGVLREAEQDGSDVVMYGLTIKDWVKRYG